MLHYNALLCASSHWYIWIYLPPDPLAGRAFHEPCDEVVGFKFAAPPQGEQGVIGIRHHALQNLTTQAGLPTAAGPSKLEPKMLHFHASISARFFSC